MTTRIQLGPCPIAAGAGRRGRFRDRVPFLLVICAFSTFAVANGSIFDDQSPDQAPLQNQKAVADQQARTDAAAKLADDLSAGYRSAVENRNGTEAERVYVQLTKAKTELKEQQLELKELILVEQELQAAEATRSASATQPSPHEPRTVIFVCDTTGSMINKIARLKVELSRAVRQLQPSQSFNIICFQNQTIIKLDNVPIVASVENQQKADALLRDLVTVGTTDPVPALLVALKSKPDVIYFLTDSADYANVQAVRNVFRQQNADHATKVNTILLAESKEEQDANRDSEPLMEWISESSGGVFRWMILDQMK
jgi:hypothetical protein